MPLSELQTFSTTQQNEELSAAGALQLVETLVHWETRKHEKWVKKAVYDETICC